MTPHPPTVSVKPVVLPVAGRGADLHVRVSAPLTGRDLPVVLFSHGYGSSLEAYGPLTDHWAASGFVVVQPTHLDSRTVGLPPDDARRPDLWRYRVEDMTRLLDHLDVLVGAVPGLDGRVDPGRVAVAGHSFGGQTAGVLLGVRVLGPDGEPGPDLSDPRVGAGVLLATAGRGGDDLAPGVIEMFPWLNPVFDGMSAPVLVVAGDADVSPLTVRGADWSEDPYRLSPAGKSLLTVAGGEHSLGGIPGYEAAETTDEDAGRVTLIRDVTSAYLRRALGVDDAEWPAVVKGLADGADPRGRIESR